MSKFVSNEEFIINKLKSNIKEANIISIIEGASGCGKTFILENIQKEQSNLNFYWLKGDSYLSFRDYYPFYELIKQLYSNDNGQLKKKLFKEASRDVVSKTGSISPLGGELISLAIENIIDSKVNRKKLVNCIFSQEELQIIFQMNYFCNNNNNNIFLCDDIQYWDSKSLQLLYLLTKNSSHQTELLSNPLFIISVTRKNDPNDKLSDIYKAAQRNIFVVDTIKSCEYGQVLKTLGLKITLDDNLVSALYSITSGNLQLSSDIVRLLNTTNQGTEEFISEIIKERNLGHLLIERLNSNSTGSEVNEALKFASLFGNTFSYFELEKALMQTEGVVRKTLKYAEEYFLVKNYSSNATFVHELIRKAYKEELSNEKERYYFRYSECIKILYPGNYRLRKDSLFYAGENEKASVMSILEHLQALRNNETNVSKDYHVLDLGYFKDYVERMEVAYRSFNAGKFKECLDALNLIEDIYIPTLLAEKYFLMSVTLSKWLDSDFRTIARECLIPFLNLESINQETELWERILSAYIVACIHDNYRLEAQKYEKLLNESITKRLPYDFDASYKLNILRRKSSMIYGEEYTFLSTQKSKNFFSENKKKVLDPVQYYMSLTNYIAAALKNGQWDIISYDIKALINIPKEYPYLHFQRIEMPLNNIIIASYIRKDITPENAVNLLKKTLKTYDTEETTSTIILSNIAVLYGLTGNFDEAFNILFEMHTKFCSIENLEFYYRYLIDRNLSSVCFAKGDKFSAINLIEKLLSINNLSHRKSFKYQTIQLLKNMKEEAQLDGYDWYINQLDYPGTYSSAPPFWSYYGKKYLFGELEFWSES